MSKLKYKLWLVILLSFCLLYSLLKTPGVVWPHYTQSQSSAKERPPTHGIISSSNTRSLENNSMKSRNLGRSVMFFTEPAQKGVPQLNSNQALNTIKGKVENSQRQRINRPIFNYLHTADNCSDDVQLLIAVCSAAQNKDQRQTIRNTWGMDATNNSAIKLVFFEGRSLNPSVQEDISKESVQYNDIVQEDFIDRYRNLSLKSISYLRWVSNRCKNVKFVLKTDDDMYINIPVLVKTLAEDKHSRYIMGYIFKNAPPMRSKKSKWFTSMDMFSGKKYPTYASGTAYGISGDLIPELYRESFYQNIFWLEDIYVTGFLAEAVKATRIHSFKFAFTQRPKNGCFYRNSISGHHVSPRNMRKIFRELNDPKLTCSFLKKKQKS